MLAEESRAANPIADSRLCNLLARRSLGEGRGLRRWRWSHRGDLMVVGHACEAVQVDVGQLGESIWCGLIERGAFRRLPETDALRAGYHVVSRKRVDPEAALDMAFGSIGDLTKMSSHSTRKVPAGAVAGASRVSTVRCRPGTMRAPISTSPIVGTGFEEHREVHRRGAHPRRCRGVPAECADILVRGEARRQEGPAAQEASRVRVRESEGHRPCDSGRHWKGVRLL